MQTIIKLLIFVFILLTIAPGCSQGQNKNNQPDAIDSMKQIDSIAGREGLLVERYAMPMAPVVRQYLSINKNKSNRDLRLEIIQQYRLIIDSIMKLSFADTIVPLTKQKRLEDLTRESSILKEAYAFIIASQCGRTNDCKDVEFYMGTPSVPKSFVEANSPQVGRLSWKNNIGVLAGPGVDTGNVSGLPWATGALISKNYFITAGHCFDKIEQGYIWPSKNGTILSRFQLARLMRVTFNYQKSQLTTLLRGDTAIYDVDSLMEYKFGGIDYAIIRLKKGRDGKYPGESDKFGILPISKNPVAEGETLCIIQHPNGEMKKVESGSASLRELPLLRYFDIDTYQQSSGSPILSVNKRALVGVHIDGKCNNSGTQPNKGRSIIQIIEVSPIVKSLAL